MTERRYIFTLDADPKPFVDGTNAANKAASDFAKSVKDTNAGFSEQSKAATGANKAVGDFRAQTIGAKGAAQDLGRALATGNFGGVADSLQTMATRTATASAAFSVAGAAVSVVGGAVLAVAAAAIKGAIEVYRFNQTLALTGNYAAMTASQVTARAKQIDAATGTGIAAAREAIEALVATGNVGPRVMQPMGEAIGRIQKLTGQAAGEIASDFARMRDGVADWAREHNKAMNFLSADQYAYIRRLEEQGKKEEAEIFVLDKLNERLGERMPKTLGWLERSWKALGDTAGAAWDAMKGIGRPETVDDALAKVTARVEHLRNLQEQAKQTPRGWIGAPVSAGSESRELDAALQEQAALQEKQRLERRSAAIGAASAATEKARIAAIDYIATIRDETKGVSLATREIEKYRRQVALLKGTQQEVSAADQAAHEAGIRKRYDPVGFKSGVKLEDAIQKRLSALGEEDAKLREQIRQYELYGHVLNNAARAQLEFEITQGKLKAASPAKIAEMRASADRVDASAELLKQRAANAEVQKSIELLRSETNAKAMNARESEAARRIADMEAKGVKIGTQEYIDNAAEIRKWVEAKHDQLLVRQLAADQLGTDLEVRRLEEETRLLGLSTLERQKAAAALRIQADAEKQLAANPGQREQIEAAAIARTERMGKALTDSYEASRRFDTGSARAIQQFVEDTGNAAQASERLFTGAFDRATDAIMEFTKTGKLNLGSLFQFMADEFLRQQARMMVSDAITGKGGIGGFLKGLGGIFGTGGGVVDPTGISTNHTGKSLVELGLGAGRAGGGGVGAGTLQEVNERGPELLTTGGRTYLMMGAEGGYVTPNNALGRATRGFAGGGSGGDVKVIVNAPPGAQVERQESRQGMDGREVEVWLRMAEQRIGENVARGRGPVANGLKSRGVNMGAALPRVG